MKNICPNCLQVTISLDDETRIKCPVCEVVFEADKGSADDEAEE